VPITEREDSPAVRTLDARTIIVAFIGVFLIVILSVAQKWVAGILAEFFQGIRIADGFIGLDRVVERSRPPVVGLAE
jgi:hypothetical protein